MLARILIHEEFLPDVVNDLILLLRGHPVLSDHEVVALCKGAIHGSRITSVLEWNLPKL